MFNGILAGAWYSYLFPKAYPLFYVDVNLDPIFTSCKESIDIGVCKILIIVLLWLTSLPVELVILLSFTVLLSIVAILIKKQQPNMIFVILGYLLFVLVSLGMYSYGNEYAYSWSTLATLITHSVILAVGLFTLDRLTRRFHLDSALKRASQ